MFTCIPRAGQSQPCRIVSVQLCLFMNCTGKRMNQLFSVVQNEETRLAAGFGWRGTVRQSTALTMSSMTFLASPKTIMVLSR